MNLINMKAVQKMNSDDMKGRAIKAIPKGRHCGKCGHLVLLDNIRYCDLWICEKKQKEKDNAGK